KRFTSLVHTIQQHGTTTWGIRFSIIYKLRGARVSAHRTISTRMYGVQFFFFYFDFFIVSFFSYNPKPSLPGFIILLGSSVVLLFLNTWKALPYSSGVNLLNVRPIPWCALRTPPAAIAARSPSFQILLGKWIASWRSSGGVSIINRPYIIAPQGNQCEKCPIKRAIGYFFSTTSFMAL